MKKINIYSLFIFSILTYTIFVLLQNIIPINKFFGLLIGIEIIFIYLSSLKKSDIWIVFFILVITSFSVINVNNISLEVEDIVYLGITILILGKMYDKNIINELNESADKYRNIFYIEIVLINIILVIGFFSPECYVLNLGQKVYRGFTYSGHTLASCITLVINIYIFYLLDEKKYIMKLLLLIIPLYSVFISGARTFLISIFITFFAFYNIKVKNGRTDKIIVLIISICVVILFLSSSMFEKIINSANNEFVSKNKLEAISSGRLIWWKYDIEAFFELDVIQKIFGTGHEFVYNVNEKMYGLKIWAHNDFIQILLSIGLFGMVGYSIIFLKLYNNLRHINKLYANIMMLYIIFPAMINGFYKYQHYVFGTLILLLILYKNEKINKNNILK